MKLRNKEAKAIAKEMRKQLFQKIISKKVGHNRGPLEQSYYWGSGWLMDYPLEKLLGCGNVLMGFEKLCIGVTLKEREKQ